MSDSNVKDKAMEDADAEKEIMEYAVKIMDFANTKKKSRSRKKAKARNAAKGTIGKIKVEGDSTDKADTENRPDNKISEMKGSVDKTKAKKEPVNNTNAKGGNIDNAKKGPNENVTENGGPAKMTKQEKRPVVNANSKKDNAIAKGRPDDLMNLARSKMQSSLKESLKMRPLSNANLKMGPVFYAVLKKGAFSNSNAKKEPVDNANKKNETVQDINTKEESTVDPSAEEESTVHPNAEEESTEEESTVDPNAEEESTEKESTVDPNAEEESTEEENTVAANSRDVLDPEAREKLAGRTLVFIQNLEQYLTRMYDIEKQGFSTIAEHHTYLLPSCRAILRGCMDLYKKSNLFPLHVSIAEFANRRTILKTIVKKALLSKGDEVSHAEFLRMSAAFLLLGYDFNRMTPFYDAVDYIIEAITEAIMETEQRTFIFLWFPFQCEGGESETCPVHSVKPENSN